MKTKITYQCDNCGKVEVEIVTEFKLHVTGYSCYTTYRDDRDNCTASDVIMAMECPHCKHVGGINLTTESI